MSLKHAVLGFLSYAPMAGYDLKRYFDQSIYHFWNANLSQIYPTLSQMVDEGLLTVEIEYQEDKPNRKVYYITDAGHEELRRWLREPIDLPQNRIAFLIKVFFCAKLGKEEILAQLRHHLALRREQLALYQGPTREVVQQNIEATGLERDGLFWGLTLEAGIKCEEAWIAWCEEAIEKIEALNSE